MSNLPSCSQKPSYFATPDFLSTTSHCLSAIELPIHLFGAYCILFKTPVKMHGVKWTMLNFNFWLAIADFTTSALIMPYLLLPAMGGVPLGLLARLGIPTNVLTYFNLSLFGGVGSAVLLMFEQRYTSFSAGTFWKKYGRYFFNIGNYTLSFTYIIPQLVWFVPDQASAWGEAQKYIPCGSHLPTESSYSLGGPVWYFTIMVFGITSYGFLALAVFSFFNFQYIWRLSVVSKHSQKLQLRLQWSLVVQAVIPLLVLLIPTTLVAGSVITGVHSQEVNNFAVLALCIHGVSSTIAMILLHQPYRMFLISLVPFSNRFYKKKTSEVTILKINALFA